MRGPIHQFLYTLDWPHKGWGSHVHNIWAYSQQQCEHSWLSQKSLWPTRTHTDKATATHTYTYTPEEINDCDLLHLIAHKPGPSTCSNNFWLSHLSRFASMRGWAASSSEIAGDERANEHLRFTVPPINLRPPLSLTKRNVHFIKTNFNARHDQQTNTWLSNSNYSRCRCMHFPPSTLFLIYLI